MKLPLKPLNRRERLLRVLRGAGVDDEDAILAGRHRDVAAGAGEHVDAPVDRQDLEVVARRRGRARGCLSTDYRRARQRHEREEDLFHRRSLG